MRRREFIGVLGGAAAALWPLEAGAQQTERMRRIGVLSPIGADNAEGQLRLSAFKQTFQELGWTDGGNVRIDYRLGGNDSARVSSDAANLVALAPDVILANGSSPVAALLEATRSIPIVFVQVNDPVSAGYVESLARPGGNATGFTLIEYGMIGKWLELLKQVSPSITRVAVLRHPLTPSGVVQLGALHAVAPSLRMVVNPIIVSSADDIERGVAAFAERSNGGLIMTTGAPLIAHRDLIVGVAARHRLPGVYPYRFFVTAGGLMSLGHDATDSYRRAAGYVDRILKGEKPADLPVQQPTKFQFAINLKTAKALGLTIPTSLLVTADEVIE
jgi:putative ABC transport system substrate-binding protein